MVLFQLLHVLPDLGLIESNLKVEMRYCVLLLLDLSLERTVLFPFLFEVGFELAHLSLELALLFMGFNLELLECFLYGACLPFMLLKVLLYLEDLLEVSLLQFCLFIDEV